MKNEVKARAHRRSGISFKISVAFCVDVTFTTKATQTRSEIPSSLTLLGFCSDRRPRLTPSQKLRLRKTQAFFFAQDDRLIDYFAVFVRHRGMSWFSLRLGHTRVLTVHRTVIHCARAASLRHPLPQNCMIHRRGDSRIARFYTR